MRVSMALRWACLGCFVLSFAVRCEPTVSPPKEPLPRVGRVESIPASRPAATATASAAVFEPIDATSKPPTCSGNNGDLLGQPELQMPDATSACVTVAQGACGHGHWTCVTAHAICQVPPKTPEVVDGVDNDCNGIVDDVPAIDVKPRVLVLGPKYIFSDAKVDVENVTAALDQVGAPYDLAPENVSWETLAPAFDKYSLLVIPGYLEPGVLSKVMTGALEGFVKRGGVVFVMKPIGTVDEPDVLRFTGLKSSAREPRTESIRFDGPSAPALASIDSPAEKSLPVAASKRIIPIDVWTYAPDEAEGTVALAHAYAGENPLGAVLTRRPLGAGAVYALGHDLATFDVVRCYVNCFEPSGDILRLLLGDALREGASGHVILKHTMAGSADAALILTHDIDAPDAYNAGAWGAPGALRMAAMEIRHGVKATYNITTDYITGYFRPQVVKQLCDEGMCPLGGHSVRHLLNFDSEPYGTCRETRATYTRDTPATLCGEVQISLDTIAEITGQKPRVWRSPYLMTSPRLFELLAAKGIQTDSSFGVGDLKYNLPVDMAHSTSHERWFHHRSIFEVPVVCEDGLGVVQAGGGIERKELRATTQRWFDTWWAYALLENARNGSITTALIHPSHGLEAPEDNLDVKIASVERLIEAAQAHHLLVLDLTQFGDFWRARAQVQVDGTYERAGVYHGSVKVGALPVTGLTLEFGDTVGTFSCAHCGRTEVFGKRVVLVDTLAPGAAMTFEATRTPSVAPPSKNGPASSSLSPIL